MLKKLMQTDEDVGMLIVRLTLGLVMFHHGAQKMLGWFGGTGSRPRCSSSRVSSACRQRWLCW